MNNGIMDIESLRICANKDRGMRKYMEDEFSVVTETEPVPAKFLGIFDGHGGKEASIYAREHLFNNIKMQSGFASSDVDIVKESIRQGFLKTHNDMFNIIDTWPKRKDGHNSTSGTTATVVIIRDNKLFIAHVGDSAAVIAKKKNNQYVAEELTVDHKPESLKEKTRIENLGGKVAATNGVPRVIWKRQVKQAISTTPRYEYVPFLAVSRALGDLWSYDDITRQFIVSPDPDICHVNLEENRHKFVILASDGLWGVMNAKQSVDHVCNYEAHHSSRKRNCSKYLVEESLQLWHKRRARADNISAIVVFLDDEFKTWRDDDDNDSVASSEADTVIVSNGEDDTPPMSMGENSINTLVRQLALPLGGTRTESECSSSSSVDSESSQQSAGKEEALPLATGALTNVLEKCPRSGTHCSSKRKINDECNSVPPRKHRKSRGVSPPSVASEESHQCGVITVLSDESIYGLQMDFVNGSDESEESDSGSYSNISSVKNMDDHLNCIPVL